jgi:Flp pilus assembly protein TadD
MTPARRRSHAARIEARRRADQPAATPAAGSGASGSAQRGTWWRAAVIAIAGLLVYSNSTSVPFVLDDDLPIVGNPGIRQLAPLSNVLAPMPDSPVAGRPVVNLSLALNYAAGGLEVRGYHLWNIAVHLCCALLVFGVVRRTLASIPRPDWLAAPADFAFVAALMWTVHPLNSEAVTYVIQRSESMMAGFYLLTLYAGIRAYGPAHTVAWTAVAIAACALGMATKESMVTAPLMMLLYDRVFRFGSMKDAVRARWPLYAGLAATWLLLLYLASSGPRASVAGFSSGVSPWTYLLNQTVMLTEYLRLTIWPRSLVAFYGWPLPLTLGDALPNAILITALLIVTIAALVRRPPLGFLGAWCFLILAPTSSIVPIATEVGAERRMYLPTVALIVLAIIGVSYVWSRLAPSGWRTVDSGATRLAGAITLAVICLVLSAGTMVRNREYATRTSIARTIVERRPSAIAHHILGEQLLAEGARPEAIAELRKAVPGNSKARHTLAIALLNDGKPEEAIEQLRAFLATANPPEPLVPRWLAPTRGEVISSHEMLGRAFLMQEKWPEAIAQLRLTLSMAPSNVEARRLLAATYFSQEQYDAAALEYREYLASRPDDVEALGNLGIALVAAEKLAEAVTVFRRAVEVSPRSAAARRNLATALFDMRAIDEAAQHAREAVALSPDSAAAHDLLGRTLAVQGKLDEARLEFERALQIDPAHADARDGLERLRQLQGVR